MGRCVFLLANEDLPEKEHFLFLYQSLLLHTYARPQRANVGPSHASSRAWSQQASHTNTTACHRRSGWPTWEGAKMKRRMVPDNVDEPHTHRNTNMQHWSLSGCMPSRYTLITGTPDHERAGPLACTLHTERLLSSRMALHSRDRSSTMGWKGRRLTGACVEGGGCRPKHWEGHPDIMDGDLAPMKT